MTYIDGFLLAVPTGRRDDYHDHAVKGAALMRQAGATRQVEGWGDDVPLGTLTDYHRAVAATDDETVVFSWIEYADKAARNAAAQHVMAAPEMADLAASMPGDGRRMIYGGFEVIVDTDPNRDAATPTSYLDGFVVPARDRPRYTEAAQRAATVFCDHGAIRVVEAWGDDVPLGTLTSFPRAVMLEEGESVAFSWVEWPSKEERDRGMAAVMADPRMQAPPAEMGFDGKRLIHGGFEILLND